MNQRVIADPSQHGWVEVDGKWVWDADGGAGAGMVISETEPTDPVEGMQWLNPNTGLVLFWDDSKWLQMPTTGAAGKDGVDGVDGLWTDEGDGLISFIGDIGVGGAATFAGNIKPSGGLHSYLWVHGADDQIGLTINRDNNRLVPYGNSKNVMDLGNTNAKFKDAYFSGTVNSNFLRSQRVIQDGSPVVDAKGLIKTLTTLRQATLDDTQDIRESLRSAIDELVAGFEQEIAAMPAEVSE